MKKASKFFSNEQLQEIEQAVADAELLTIGEIVPVVATCSGRYDRAEDIFGLLTGMLSFSAAWFYQRIELPASDDWQTQILSALPLPYALLVLVGGFIIGALIAAYFPSLKLLFISKQEMKEQVELRAMETFYRCRIGNTKDSTGVLIYVSLYECRVIVQGDDAIADRLDQQDWDEVCGLIVHGMKTKDPAQGLRSAIAQCGKLLGQHFPKQAGNENELPNKLVLID